jgi:hypothetical protein
LLLALCLLVRERLAMRLSLSHRRLIATLRTIVASHGPAVNVA